ncbi:MAG: 3-hydroxyacyl-ACP dehydratase FabZ [Candidatus Sumerlaeia bacterium]|nr:3-hydroxyacyl-ACP dehydratase FabZ [Candidatus Sumerlaeia bacterium]
MKFLHQPPFGSDTIKLILPHRYPFLLIDTVDHLDEAGVRGRKLLTVNEEVFNGHFPQQAVYPGVLQVETMAQLGAVWVLSQEEHAGKIAYLMGVNNAKFRRPALPGQVLHVEGVVSKMRSRTGQLDARILVDGKEISSAEILFAFAKHEPAGSGAAAD